MSILDSIKAQVKSAGSNKGKFVYFKEDVKHRIRFLTEFDEGMEIAFHDSYEEKIMTPCFETFGEDCPYCNKEGLRTRSQFLWSVWDYDANEVKVLMAPVNNCSPVPGLMGFYDEYGTILDRDYVLKKTGKGTNSSYTIVPGDKAPFNNKKAKAYTDSAIKSIVRKAYCENGSGDEDGEDTKAVKSKKNKDDDDGGLDWTTPEEKSDAPDYSEMSAVDLYKLCKKKGLNVEKKMKSKYYITKLNEAEKADDDWGDEDEGSDEE